MFYNCDTCNYTSIYTKVNLQFFEKLFRDLEEVNDNAQWFYSKT